MKFRALGFLLALLVLAGCAGTKVVKKPVEDSAKLDQRMAEVQEKIRREGPSDAAYFELAQLALAKGDTMRAFVYLDSTLALRPDNAEARLLKADLLYKRQQLRSAFEEYLVLLESDTTGKWSQQVGRTIGLIYPIRQLTKDNSDHANPSFSPDGKWIAFQGNAEQNWDLYLLNRETGKIRRLTRDPLDEEAPVFWGTSKIVFTRQQSAETHNRDIFVLDLSTLKETPLVVHPADDWFPAVSRDSTRIYFVSDRGREGSPPTQIYVYDLKANTVHPLIAKNAGGTSPSLSADGQKLIFTRLEDGYYRPFQANPEGKGVKPLSGLEMHFGAPKFSPDGKKVVFFSKLGSNFDIFELDLQTNHLERLTAHPGRDLAPSYSPDGSQIVFYSNRTGRYQLYALDVQKPFSRLDIIKRLRAALNGEAGDLQNISGLISVGQ